MQTIWMIIIFWNGKHAIENTKKYFSLEVEKDSHILASSINGNKKNYLNCSQGSHNSKFKLCYNCFQLEEKVSKIASIAFCYCLPVSYIEFIVSYMC